MCYKVYVYLQCRQVMLPLAEMTRCYDLIVVGANGRDIPEEPKPDSFTALLGLTMDDNRQKSIRDPRPLGPSRCFIL